MIPAAVRYQYTAWQQAKAYHESGHCVVAFVMGFEVESATIDPEPYGGGGQTHYRVPSTAQPAAELAATLAGAEAQQRWAGGHGPTMSAVDYALAQRVLSHAHGRPYTAPIERSMVYLQARQLARDTLSLYPESVHVVARQLLERGSISERLIRFAFRDEARG